MNLFKQKFLKVPHLSIVGSIREGGRNPFVDWILILAVSFVITIVFIINGINLYERVISGDIQNNNITSDNTVKTFNENELKMVVNKINEKENALMQVRRGYSDSINPAK